MPVNEDGRRQDGRRQDGRRQDGLRQDGRRQDGRSPAADGTRAAAAATRRPADGRDGAALGAGAVVIARRLSLSSARTIGLVPVSRTGDILPLLLDVAQALAPFVDGTVGCIPPWQRWDGSGIRAAGGQSGGGAVTGGDDGESPVALVSPAACRDRQAAARQLEGNLDDVEWKRLTRLLVDLSDYASPGQLPVVAGALDGLVLLVEARRTRRSAVARLAAALPSARNLGTILLD